MNKTELLAQAEALETALAALYKMADPHNDGEWLLIHELEAREKNLRAQASSLPDEAQPVAWGFRFEDGELSDSHLWLNQRAADQWHISDDCQWAGEIVALYTSPPTPDKGKEWQPIETAPKDRFILLYCPEDKSTWLAKWQSDQWYGVDDEGLTRVGMGPHDVTGWKVTAWQPLPTAPKEK